MKLAAKHDVFFRIRKYLRVFAMAGGIIVMTESARCEEMLLPTKVQAFIGMEIPPVIKSVASGSIPNFISLSSSSAVTRHGTNPSIGGRNVGFYYGVLADRAPVLFVIGHDKNLTTKIFDVLILPPDLIDWYFKGDFKYALRHDRQHWDRYFKWYWQDGQTGRFMLSESCGSNENDERYIIGMIKQENGKESCSHYSKRVKLAWLIDKESGRLTRISTQGLQCHYIAAEDCY